ncbi:10312_t:CDS:2, partial [Cetraspora pellucida]
IMKYQLSYKTGDAILKFVKKYSKISEKVLPRSTKDGLHFLDNLKKSHNEFFLTPVIQIKDQVYFFEYQPIISAIKKIFQNKEIAANCVFDYQEIYISIMWGHAQQHISPENKVLAIILYSDATMLDRLEKISRHPVFISLGNIPTKFCNKPEAKALVGIIPTLQGTLEERQIPQFRQMIRSTFHKCMNILFEPLHSQYHLGVLFKVNGRDLKCNMMLSCVIGDWPENCKYCLTYSGANCAHPCHTCLVEKDKLNAINLPSNHKIIRTENLMRQIMEMGKCKDYSLHEETNSFWTHLNFNIYTATVPEQMHYLDLGLFSYMVKFTQDLLKFHGGIFLVNKMDLRFGLIPRYPGLKIFNVGLAELTLSTASEYKQMMKVMPFILEVLLEEKKNESLVQMYVNWNKMYNKLKQCKFTQSDLSQFE